MAVKTYDGWSGSGKRNCPDYIAITLNRQWQEGALAVLAGVYEIEAHEKRDLATREFLETLSGLVAQWIDSGRSERDPSIEEPWKRDVQWRSASYPEPVVTTLTAYWKRNHLQVLIDGNGRSSIYVTPAVTGPTDASLRARDRAVSLFITLLDCATRERLFRCVACRAYFVRARAPKRDIPIFRGTFCPNCKGKGSVKRMNATRENRANRMIELAAELWPKWKQKARYGKRSKWLAAEMNRTLSHSGQTITSKWVTQHQQEIEVEVQRRK